jgi:hypothetical protein
LLFFYWGSQGPATLSEFRWQPLNDETLKVAWIVKHEYDYLDNDDDDEESDGEEEETEEKRAEQRDDTVVPFGITGDGLIIRIGMHDFDYALRRAAPADNFTEDKIKWTEFTRTFNPFGPGRQVWLTSGNNQWQKTNLQVQENKPWWKFW